MSGKHWFIGSLEDLLSCLFLLRYNEEGAGKEYLSNGSKARFLVGNVVCTTMQDLVDSFDYTLPTPECTTCPKVLKPPPECTVVFTQGLVRNTESEYLSYDKWYESQGLARIYFHESWGRAYKYAYLDSIPGSWRADSTGEWHPPTSPWFPHAAA